MSSAFAEWPTGDVGDASPGECAGVSLMGSLMISPSMSTSGHGDGAAATNSSTSFSPTSWKTWYKRLSLSSSKAVSCVVVTAFSTSTPESCIVVTAFSTSTPESCIVVTARWDTAVTVS